MGQRMETQMPEHDEAQRRKEIEVGEKIATVLDEANFEWNESARCIAAIVGANIDAYARSFPEAESMLHQVYRLVKIQMYDLEREGRLAYQTRLAAN